MASTAASFGDCHEEINAAPDDAPRDFGDFAAGMHDVDTRFVASA